jgi:hypothetical protein
MKLYTYVVAKDYGLAPNPFWGKLSLNVCKPKIRLAAQVGDWVIGTGSKNVKMANGKMIDFSGKLVYAMKVVDKITMQKYDQYCKKQLQKKIPYVNERDWRIFVGDCIYDFSISLVPRLRKVIHNEKNKGIDLGGKFTLLSDSFFYFGENAVELKSVFPELVRDANGARGHTVVKDLSIIIKFERWLYNKFICNKLYGNPQLRWMIEDTLSGVHEIKCDN